MSDVQHWALESANGASAFYDGTDKSSGGRAKPRTPTTRARVLLGFCSLYSLQHTDVEFLESLPCFASLHYRGLLDLSTLHASVLLPLTGPKIVLQWVYV